MKRELRKGIIRGVHQSNEPDNPNRSNLTRKKQPETFGLGGGFCLCQPETFGLSGGLRISQPEQPNPTREINN